MEFSKDCLYAFLKFHARIVKSTQMPYLRKLVALEYCRDNLKMNYETAEEFMDHLLENGWVEWDKHGAFPGTILTSKGNTYLQELSEIYQDKIPFESKNLDNSLLKSSSSSFSTPPLPVPSKNVTITWGPTKNLENLDTSELNINEEDLYLFLKFVIGVSSGAGSPYLREIVAEDFLMDKLHLTYEKTDLFITRLIDAALIDGNQYGAFPGISITTKGKEVFEALQKKKHLNTSKYIE